MYKIYVNDTPLYLVGKGEKKGLPGSGPAVLEQLYHNNHKQFLQLVDMLEKSNRWEAVVLRTDDVKATWKAFKSLFVFIKAAGGLIQNQQNELLWIFRRGYWDFPKGKIDAGEKKKKAALREVEEETGVKDARIMYRLPNTFHTYKGMDGKRVLKKTIWYFMKASKQELKPQKEEDIELAEWKNMEDFAPEESKLYGSINDTLESFMSDYQ